MRPLFSRSHLLVLFATTFIATPAFAQDPAIFERVLVPISVSGVQGTYGTRWSTELWYRNNGTKPVAVQPLAVSDYVPTIGRTERLPVGNFPADAPGTILFVSREGADQVQFDLRLYNQAEPQLNWGTKLPVVRERDFSDTVNLINVPTNDAFRSTLRIYGLSDSLLTDTSIDLRIYSNDERLLASAALPIQGWPGYAEVSFLADRFPATRQVDRVRVLVRSNAGVKLWAFVSVVANSSQTVSIITPE